MIKNPHTLHLAGKGTKEDPLHVRVITPTGIKRMPWWAITIGTVVVTYMTQRFLAKRMK